MPRKSNPAFARRASRPISAAFGFSVRGNAPRPNHAPARTAHTRPGRRGSDRRGIQSGGAPHAPSGDPARAHRTMRRRGDRVPHSSGLGAGAEFGRGVGAVASPKHGHSLATPIRTSSRTLLPAVETPASVVEATRNLVINFNAHSRSVSDGAGAIAAHASPPSLSTKHSNGTLASYSTPPAARSNCRDTYRWSATLGKAVYGAPDNSSAAANSSAVGAGRIDSNLSRCALASPASAMPRTSAILSTLMSSALPAPRR